MATLDKVVIQITGDTKSINKTIDRLEKVGKVDKKNAVSFKKTSKEFQQNQRKNQKSLSILEKSVGNLGTILAGAFAIGAIVTFTKQLAATASQMEAFERRAKVVFGSSIGIIEEFGKQNAISLGLTENAFKGAAAAVGDILVPLGLSRKRAAEMSVQAVKLGSALREFTGDQRSAAEISEIVAKSFTGEVEGLKGLGVVVNQNDKDFKALIKTKINVLGLTESQAKAEAIFETVLMRSSDALNSFETNTDSLARQQAELDAQTGELSETLAILLTPAFLSTTKAANTFFKSLNDGTFILKEIDFQTEKTIEQLEENRRVYIGLREAQGLAVEESVLFAIEQEILAARMRETTDAGKKLSEQSLEGTEAIKRAIQVWRDAKKANEDLKDSQQARVKTIGDLKKELGALRSAQDLLVPGSEALLLNQARVTEIQKILKGEIEKSVGAFATLSKQVSELKKELKDQSVEGTISKDTIKALDDAVDELVSAEVDLQLAIAGTLPLLKAQELELDKVGGKAQSAADLLRDFEQIQRDEIEATANKRLDAIDKVSMVEQQAFRIIAQINTNKLIGINNEERAELKALEEKGLGEEELAVKRLEIQTRFDEQRAKILTKQAKADKIAAIFEATIATAVAVTKTLDNPVLAAIVAVLGAAEIAFIAAQPIPEFHEGKKPGLKDGEIYAKILESESVIPPDQSKKYKGAIDSMIDKNFESYVFKEYMLPMMKSMGKGQHGTPYDDINLWHNQKKQIKLMTESNQLTKAMLRSMDSGNKRRSWR